MKNLELNQMECFTGGSECHDTYYGYGAGIAAASWIGGPISGMIGGLVGLGVMMASVAVCGGQY